LAAVREVTVLALFGLAYGGVRALTEGSAQEAMLNAERVLHAEEAAGLAWEQAVQTTLLGSDAVISAANWVYIWGYFPYIITAAVFIWLRSRDRYVVLRNAVLLSGVGGARRVRPVPDCPSAPCRQRLRRHDPRGLTVVPADPASRAGQHYVLDVMAGVLLVLAAPWVSATWLSRFPTPAATLDRRAVDRPLPVRRRPPSGQRSRARSRE
jgi:hypothetical protein